MKVSYDGAEDVLYIELRDGRVIETEEFRPGLFVDLDDEGRIVGIELVDASEHVEEPASIRVEQRSG